MKILRGFHTCYMASLPRRKQVFPLLVAAQVLRISTKSNQTCNVCSVFKSTKAPLHTKPEKFENAALFIGGI